MAGATPAKPHPDPLAQTVADKVTRLLIAGAFFDAQRLSDKEQGVALQIALHEARTRFGHALCLCRRTPLKLQIRLREARYHMAVWPEEGPQHNSNCGFFREEESLQTDAEYRSTATEQPDGTRALRLSFSLNRTRQDGPREAQEREKSKERQPVATPASQGGKAPQQEPNPATLAGLAHIVWGQANLTRWHPQWSRDWGRARYELIQAAQKLIIGSEPLSERLFVPRPYRDAQREVLNQEWEKYVQRLARGNSQVTKSGILIAPIRRKRMLEGGSVVLHLRHLRHPVGLYSQVHDFLASNCEQAMRKIPTQAGPGVDADTHGLQANDLQPIAIMQVEATSRGGLWARAAWVFTVHPQYFLPARTLDDALLIDTLVKGKYEFSRIHSEARALQRNTPDWLVRHVVDPRGIAIPRAALEIAIRGSGAEVLMHRAVLADKLARQGIPLWYWNVSGPQKEHVVPDLPPRNEGNKADISEALDKLLKQSSVSYTYGSRS